jgi:chemotaxis signal transduction protein
MKTIASHRTLKEQIEVSVVVFTIAGYRLGLPIETVLRVVNCPPELRDQHPAIASIELGQQTLTVLSLHAHLNAFSSSQPRSQGEFLLVTKLGEKLLAIRVDAPPDIVQFDPSMLRQLPATYRQGHPLNVASRVAVLPQGKATLAVFLLDLHRVMATLAK